MISTQQNAQSTEWAVQIVNAKQEATRFKPNKKLSKIPLTGSSWSCFLSETLHTKLGDARSIDCKYGKTKALVSVKLFCEKAISPMAVVPQKNTTFALAEDKGAGYLLELVCRPSK